MTALIWLLRLLVFVVLVVFALRNTEPMTLRFIGDFSWQAPQVLVLFVFFFLGVLLGVLGMLRIYLRQRHQVLLSNRVASVSPPSAETAVSPLEHSRLA